MIIRRALGEGQTQYERDAEAAIRLVPQWVGRDISYRMMVGGLNNRNWRVEIYSDPRAYFLKVPGEGTEAFIDRAASHEAATAAHGLGIAPEVVFFDPKSGVEVHEFLDGFLACTTADFARADKRDEVIELLRILHGGPRLSLTKTIFDLIDEHLEQARSLGSAMPEDIDWLLYHYERIRTAFMASGLDLVTCFNDPMPGNFLSAPGERMRLIDYEFASLNERTYDIGVFACEMFLEEDETLKLIETYFGEVRADVVARVNLCRILADIKWGSWAVVSRKLNDWYFDFQKYGLWKFMRARDKLRESRMDAWLRAV